MRQVTKQAISAFLAGKQTTISNTTIRHNKSGITIMYLFGNEIARKNWEGKGEISISNAGWKSNTTKERLNGIPGVSINQAKGKWYLNGKEWDGKWITINQ